MLLYTIFGIFLFAIDFGTRVDGYPGSIITVKSAKVTNNPNEYFEPWSVDVIPTKKSSLLDAKVAMKKALPDTMLFAITIILQDQEPIEYSMPLCEALNDEMIGKKFARAGRPKDKFPKQCPFVAGDWSIEKFEPPVELIPPGIPNGPLKGSVMMMEEGKEPYIKIDYEGELSNSLPGLGR